MCSPCRERPGLSSILNPPPLRPSPVLFAPTTSEVASYKHSLLLTSEEEAQVE